MKFLTKGQTKFSWRRISQSEIRNSAGRLEIDFKKPFNLLAKLPAEARAAGEGEAEHSSNSLWWRWRESNPRAKNALIRFYET